MTWMWKARMGRSRMGRRGMSEEVNANEEGTSCIYYMLC